MAKNGAHMTTHLGGLYPISLKGMLPSKEQDNMELAQVVNTLMQGGLGDKLSCNGYLKLE